MTERKVGNLQAGLCCLKFYASHLETLSGEATVSKCVFFFSTASTRIYSERILLCKIKDEHENNNHRSLLWKKHLVIEMFGSRLQAC